jgi:hypothetical protein
VKQALLKLLARLRVQVFASGAALSSVAIGLIEVSHALGGA